MNRSCMVERSGRRQGVSRVTKPAEHRDATVPADAHTDTNKGLPTGERERLGELAMLFSRLGFTAFGGPVAHIAMMRQEFVQRRKWISDQHFVDLIGVVNLIPGPNSTE